MKTQELLKKASKLLKTLDRIESEEWNSLELEEDFREKVIDFLNEIIEGNN